MYSACRIQQAAIRAGRSQPAQAAARGAAETKLPCGPPPRPATLTPSCRAVAAHGRPRSLALCDVDCDVSSSRRPGIAAICASGARPRKMGLNHRLCGVAAYFCLSPPISSSKLTRWRSAVRARTGLPFSRQQRWLSSTSSTATLPNASMLVRPIVWTSVSAITCEAMASPPVVAARGNWSTRRSFRPCSKLANASAKSSAGNRPG